MLNGESSPHTSVSYTWTGTSGESENDNTGEVEPLRGENRVFGMLEIEYGLKRPLDV